VHFLTWRTYGTWLPGDERGSIDRARNGYAQPIDPPDGSLANMAAGQMKHPVFILTPRIRERVDSALREACAWRNWELLGLNVRSNHVHLVFAGEVEAANAVTVLKARVSRVLWEDGAVARGTAIWSRGGSHRVLRRTSEVEAAVDYVMNRQ
jgi:REP element-mobilizing transposase RayT